MARRWTKNEETFYKKELEQLYIRENKTISEIGTLLGISEKTVFKRLHRLQLRTAPSEKTNFRNKRNDITLPSRYSDDLAEVFGILLGDGHISKYQVVVTLGSKEKSYANYVQELLEKVLKCKATVSTRKAGYYDVYIGSKEIVNWFIEQGLVHHKVKSQVDCPLWIQKNEKYSQKFIRGFFDTDGTVYSLKKGVQIAFTNASLPLLQSTRNMLLCLGYKPSVVSANKVYLTRQENLDRFFSTVLPQNKKHVDRFYTFKNTRVGTQVVNEGRL